jgi:hypothetical protein
MYEKNEIEIDGNTRSKAMTLLREVFMKKRDKFIERMKAYVHLFLIFVFRANDSFIPLK